MKTIGQNLIWFEDVNKVVVKATNPKTIEILSKASPELVQDYGTSIGFLFPVSDYLCQLLVNLGLLQAMFLSGFYQGVHTKIEGKYEPMKHQLITAAFMIFHPRCYVLSDCRLGKTGSAIIGLDYLQKVKAIKGGVLIITTLTTVKSVWERNIRETLPEDNIILLHGKKSCEQLNTLAAWYITNYDTVRLNTKAFEQAIKQHNIDAILIDELTHVGNSSSQRHKAIFHLANRCGLQYVIGMTGSPGSDPEPIFGMAKTVNPSRLPANTKTAWLNLTTFSYGPQPYMRRPSADCGQYIFKALQPAIRFKKEHVLDLPPITFQDRVCSLHKEQTKMLIELKDSALAIAQNGEAISAANAGVLLTKMLQVPLGFIINNEGDTIDLPCGDRDEVILDIINESSSKVVIFSMFKRRLINLENIIKKNKISVARIDGSIVGDIRSNILDAFSNKVAPKVLVCHPTTVGFGTELSAADTLVLDGPPLLGNFSYTQTLERLSSPKQKAATINIIRVHSTKEEQDFFKKLESGQTAGKAIASLFEELRCAKA